jgi:hypothetical protein
MGQEGKWANPPRPAHPETYLAPSIRFKRGPVVFPEYARRAWSCPLEGQGSGDFWGSSIIFSELYFCGAVRESRTWDGPPAISVPYTRSTKFTCFLCHYKMKQPFSSATQTPAGPDNWRTPEMACLPLWPSLQGAKFDNFLRHYYMV